MKKDKNKFEEIRREPMPNHHKPISPLDFASPSPVSEDWEKAVIKVEIIGGVEGECLSINDYRVAGPKPWGGGIIVQSWEIRVSDIPAIKEVISSALSRGKEEGRREVLEEVLAVHERVKKMAYCVNGKGQIVYGLYTDEKMRGPNVECYELINKFSVLTALSSLISRFTKE